MNELSTHNVPERFKDWSANTRFGAAPLQRAEVILKFILGNKYEEPKAIYEASGRQTPLHFTELGMRIYPSEFQNPNERSDFSDVVSNLINHFFTWNGDSSVGSLDFNLDCYGNDRNPKTEFTVEELLRECLKVVPVEALAEHLVYVGQFDSKDNAIRDCLNVLKKQFIPGS